MKFQKKLAVTALFAALAAASVVAQAQTVRIANQGDALSMDPHSLNESLLGADHVERDLEPSMGAEDFSFMLQNKPGAYLRIGQGTGASGSALHNSRYDFNDDILPLGAALHASLIEQSMPLPAV